MLPLGGCNDFSSYLRAPCKGAGSLAGGERSEPPVIIKHMNAPRQGRGEILQPLPGCASLVLFYPGVRFAHPRLSSIPPQREYVTVFRPWSTESVAPKIQLSRSAATGNRRERSRESGGGHDRLAGRHGARRKEYGRPCAWR